MTRYCNEIPQIMWDKHKKCKFDIKPNKLNTAKAHQMNKCHCQKAETGSLPWKLVSPLLTICNFLEMGGNTSSDGLCRVKQLTGPQVAHQETLTVVGHEERLITAECSFSGFCRLMLQHNSLVPPQSKKKAKKPKI